MSESRAILVLKTWLARPAAAPREGLPPAAFEPGAGEPPWVEEASIVLVLMGWRGAKGGGEGVAEKAKGRAGKMAVGRGPGEASVARPASGWTASFVRPRSHVSTSRSSSSKLMGI